MSLPTGVEVLMSIDRLSVSRDFKRMVEWMQDQRRKAADTLLAAEDVATMQRAQGKVLALDELLNTIRDAPGALAPKERNNKAF